MTLCDTGPLIALLDRKADASVVVATETLGLRQVFTLDRHFYAYRLADGMAFEVVP